MLEISKIVIGDKVNDGVYCLKSVSRASDNYNVVLKDKTGELLCELARERFNDNLNQLVGGAVKTTFIVKNGINTTPLGVIKSIEKADVGSYKPSELFDGLSEERIAHYRNDIRECLGHIRREDLKTLVAKILDEQMLSQLAKMPATLSYYGIYGGGALAATAVITKMALQTGFQYVKGENGLYKSNLDWDILISASLLMYCGVPEYFTDSQPFRKTSIGIERGYISVLQKKIESCNEAVDELTLARIFNIMASSAPYKTGVTSTHSEGDVLCNCTQMYERLDRSDSGRANHEPEEGEAYFYDAKLRRYISLPESEAG